MHKTPPASDMYPQFWTPRIGGIFMKYSYEYKKNCIELYRQGKWPETPDGIKQENFRISVRRWSRREKSCGAESLQKNPKKMWSADEKYELIAKVLAGESITESAISAGVEPSLLSQGNPFFITSFSVRKYSFSALSRISSSRSDGVSSAGTIFFFMSGSLGGRPFRCVASP